VFTPTNPALAAALLGSHEMDVRVDVYLGATLIYGDLPIRGGAVDATLGTRAGRRALFAVDRRYLPYVTPLGARVLIRTGIATMEMVPIFEGRIDSVPDDHTGSVEVVCVGRGQDVQDARFEVPYAISAGVSLLGQLTNLLITGTYLGSVEVQGVVQDKLSSVLVYEEDRGSACDDIARALQVIWSEGRAGQFRIFPNPFAALVQPPAVVLLRDGVNGVLASITRTTSRTLISNSVTVVVERTDGSEPIRATARDNTPTSPTFWSGPFGRQNSIVKTQAPLSQADAAQLAGRLLSQSLALQRSWTISVPHYPLLDPGDVIAVWWNNEVSAQVVESITYPLSADQPTLLATREWRSGAIDPASLEVL
jgi:hypothetical protein